MVVVVVVVVNGNGRDPIRFNNNCERIFAEATLSKYGPGLLLGEDDIVVDSQTLPEGHYRYRLITQPQQPLMAPMQGLEVEDLYKAMSLHARISSGEKQRHDTDKTSAGYAAGIKSGIGYETFAGKPGESFLSEAECVAAQRSILSNKHERFLVAYMTPIFEKRLMPIFGSDLVLVNSEEYNWFPQSANIRKHYLAPDQFIAPHYLVKFREPYKNAPLIIDGQYGIFPIFNARGSLLVVFDAKTSLDEKAQGGCMKYLEGLSFSSDDEILTVRGVFYDAQTCCLMKAIKGQIVDMRFVRWSMSGSLEYIHDFLRPRREDGWDVALKMACAHFKVTLPRYSSNEGSRGQCILGAGAFGRVFRVGSNEGEVREYAMKLVLGRDCVDGLRREFEEISNLPAEVHSLIVNVIPTSFWTTRSLVSDGRELNVAAFLMPIVGNPFDHPDELSDDTCRSILESLSELHANGIAHGDARYKNVVRVADMGADKGKGVAHKFRWIDFRTRGTPNSLSFANDVECFLTSTDRPVNAAQIDAYARKAFTKSFENVNERIEVVRNLVVPRIIRE